MIHLFSKKTFALGIALLLCGSAIHAQVFKKESYSVDEILKILETKCGMEVIFDPGVIDLETILTVDNSKTDVAKALQPGFLSAGMVATFINDYVVINPKAIDDKIVAKMGEKIHGRVTDSSGEPLVGASIFAAGSTKGTVADVNGKFEMTLPPYSRLLIVDFLGMKTLLQPVTVSSDYDLVLQPGGDMLDEVVVTGYGSQRKADITGAVTSIGARELEKNVGATLESALQGNVPGLNIVTNSGEPGSGSTITLRGASSINGTSTPLYIIDGVPVDSDNINTIDGDASFSPLAGLSPSDIASIDILRDAASAAIYGSRAANGVVIITTKGGNDLNVSKPTINFGHRSGVAILSHKLPLMGSEDFRRAYSDARENQGTVVSYPWVTNFSNPLFNFSTDWQDVMYKPAYQQQTDFNVSGSNGTFSYGLGLVYQNQNPILQGTSHQMYSFRANFNYRLSKHITAGTNVFYTNTDYQRVIAGQSNFSGAVRSITSAPPVFSPYDEEGNVRDMLYGDYFKNPLAVATKYPLTYKDRNVRVTQYFQIKFTPDLKFKSYFSLAMTDNTQNSYFPKVYDTTANTDIYRYRDTEGQKYINENTLSYAKTIKRFSIDAVLGCSFSYRKNVTDNQVGRDFIDETQIAIQNASIWSAIGQTETSNAMQSYFGRANLSFDNKYLMTATVRADGSSRFGPNRRFGVFPSVSLGWRFSEEKFMRFAKRVLSNAKLRASYGRTGNQTVGDYTWRGVYGTASSRYDSEVAILNTALSNPDLGWETTTQGNVGLDLVFFHGRLNITADAYLKKTTDLLFNTPIANVSGFSQRSTNLGAIQNKGLELAVNGVLIEKGNFSWDMSANLSMNRNKVIELAGGKDVIYSTDGVYSLCRVGEPIGVFYGWKARGVYARDEDNVDGVRKGTQSGNLFKGGDMIWADLNNDKVINDDDRAIIGDPNPDFFGGFGTSLTWKNLSVKAFFTYSVGGDIINCQRRLRYQMASLSNIETDANRRWRKQGDQTDFPMFRYSDPMDNFRCSDFFIEDGTYLRLKDVSITYNLPKKWCQKIHTRNIGFTLSGTNLLTWTNYSGYDPEVNTSSSVLMSGLDNGAFPKSRLVSLGLKVTF